VCVCVCVVFVMYCTDGLNVALQVWDIGGQSIGGRMLDKYIYGSHVSTTTLTVVSCLLLPLACDSCVILSTCADMLRNIGKQSGESMESVCKKKRKATVRRICRKGRF